MLSVLRKSCCNNFFIVYKSRSTVPLPDLHVLNEKCDLKQDLLYTLRVQTTPVTGASESSLAGQPKVLPSAVLQLREDIIAKWNQKPAKDLQKELAKQMFTY